MARGINKFIGVGNLCADPETRAMPSGGTVTNIRVALNDQYKSRKTGDMVDNTEYIRVVFFNRLAEVAAEYLKKGSKVYIEGSLKTRQWEKEGRKHYTTEIVAREMQMLDSRSDPGSKYQPPSAGSNQSFDNSPTSGEFSEPFDDDIPF